MASSFLNQNLVSLYDRWHSGERRVQDMLYIREAVQEHSAIFRPFLTEQMQNFVPTLNYFFFGTLDDQGRPWVSILTGPKGFLHSPHPRTLDIKATLETGRSGLDPVFFNLVHGESFKSGKRMWGGVGLDFSNRRRNKMNGVLYPADLLVADETSRKLHVRLTVEQTIGNCPKYITTREMEPCPRQNSDSIHAEAWAALANTSDEESPRDLAEDEKAVIHQADCLFISSRFIDESLADQTSGMDCNHRGGNPGFVRLNGKRLVFPDYSGNRFFNTLGNIANDERIGILFINFDTGDVLHLTGRAHIFVGKEAQVNYPHAQRCVQVTIDDHLLRKDALPFRMRTKELSPYNPTVPSSQHRTIEEQLVGRTTATLSGITKHNKDISTFRFNTSRPIRYIPGQYAVLDFGQFNTLGYRHMALDNPQSLNDDYVRTWTISSAPLAETGQESAGWQRMSEFTITVKRKPGGAISNLLHDMVLDDRQPFTVPLISTGGSFVLPSVPSSIPQSTLKAAMISGGIGSTPFISMVRGARQLRQGPVDIQWVISAPYFSNILPEILQDMIAPEESMEGGNADRTKHSLTLAVNVFLTRGNPETTSPTLLELSSTKFHFSRLDSQSLLAAIPDLQDRQILLCGPEPFMDAVKKYLEKLGIPAAQVMVEDFNF
ncbi:hypothetical protein BC939DRAFT_500600 [Gamsiella multidivaricata]|uniref:uncharacterized protein n=1 Tax=Gamsiella multidivaricata TaxID=101098 RepID=UPI00221FFA12|nr:uncharacterized protein BC939DRAFT_500600 [Gamsiella multidivaricata]KAI7828819.1 hypothetical protein BC939DRAFT_500600 [Gamsiella multidivaricata]